MNQVVTEIITKNTCLIRGKGSYDEKTEKRFFGYYGKKPEFKNFCKSKKFVTKYAINNEFEYYKVLKNIHLLYIPYFVTYDYHKDDVKIGLELAKFLIEYCLDNKKNKIIIEDVVELLLSPLTEDEIQDKELISYKNKYSKSTMRNPDFSLLNLICELGFQGWIRLGNRYEINPYDEITICDIKYCIKNGYLESSKECDLETLNNIICSK